MLHWFDINGDRRLRARIRRGVVASALSVLVMVGCRRDPASTRPAATADAPGTDARIVEVARAGSGSSQSVLGNTVAGSGSTKVDDVTTTASDVVPEPLRGQWKMAQSTYFSILGVAYSGPVSGRNLCLTLHADGHFEAELSEFALGGGFEPCGPVARCTLRGEVRPNGKQWTVIEQNYSCGMRRTPPIEYRGRLSVSGKILSLQFEGGGLFGPLSSFGMVRGSCNTRPNGYPPCRGGPPSRPELGIEL